VTFGLVVVGDDVVVALVVEVIGFVIVTPVEVVDVKPIGFDSAVGSKIKVG